MKLNPIVNRILAFTNIDHFTAIEIRSAYLVLNNDQQVDPAQARKFVYTELVKLVNKGWLKKVTTQKKGITRYSKTELFDSRLIDNAELEVKQDELIKTESNSLNEQLNSRLHQYKKQLLEGLGSIEECSSLRNNFTDFHTLLKPKYNSLRENNYILMGKIKVLEELISSHKETIN